ncbi:hypothetical protein B0O99DRAFT_675486 [Bisporella sp. PMI_857]|nr:hypothetical protein B0O99DRAFT_675486 [Bisporella sp. PMI_857]
MGASATSVCSDLDIEVVPPKYETEELNIVDSREDSDARLYSSSDLIVGVDAVVNNSISEPSVGTVLPENEVNGSSTVFGGRLNVVSAIVVYKSDNDEESESKFEYVETTEAELDKLEFDVLKLNKLEADTLELEELELVKAELEFLEIRLVEIRLLEVKVLDTVVGCVLVVATEVACKHEYVALAGKALGDVATTASS